MDGGPAVVALQSRVNWRNCSRFIRDTSRASTSPLLSYSVKSACSTPPWDTRVACVAATSSALASGVDAARDSLTRSSHPERVEVEVSLEPVKLRLGGDLRPRPIGTAGRGIDRPTAR